MNYEQALEYIHGTYKFGSKLGLENILELLKLMGNPHENLRVIHVAGTNGKGSTSSFISSVLVEQGYKVGLYTSPFLEEFTERIRVNGEDIPKEDLAEITAFVKSKVEIMLSMGKNHPTEFEVVTAIGFEYFYRQQIDFLVLEVGLGGRGDSTNVIAKPLVSVITPIDYDHMDYLGDTLAKIAFEKAGIIKVDSFVVSYPQRPEAMEVIDEVCNSKNAKLIIAPVDNVQILNQEVIRQSFNIKILDEAYDEINISMIGIHQVNNAVVALTALELLKREHGINIAKEAIYEGIRKTRWPGRLELMGTNPTILIDGAHNVHGLKAVSTVIDKYFSNKSIILVIGILGDKDVDSMLEVIVPKVNKVVLTKPDSPRALAVDVLEEKLIKYDKPIMKYEAIEKAVYRALDWANPDEVVVFCGSLYMIGHVRTMLKKMK